MLVSATWHIAHDMGLVRCNGCEDDCTSWPQLSVELQVAAVEKIFLQINAIGTIGIAGDMGIFRDVHCDEKSAGESGGG